MKSQISNLKSKAPALHCAHARLVPTSKLKPNPQNPNKHSAEQLKLYAKIIRHQGWRRAIVVSKRSGLIVTGHGAWLAAKAEGWPQVPVDFQNFKTSADEFAHLIADNKLPQMAEIDDELLAAILAEEFEDGFDLELTGLTGEELESLDPAIEPPEPKLDQAEALLKKWKVKRGQLWQIGEHRLLCGDSTNDDEVARLNIAKFSTLVFDPEWDKPPTSREDFRKDFETVLAFSDGQRVGDVIARFGSPAWLFVWDCGSCWFTPSRPLKQCKLCLWFGDVTTYKMDGAHYGDAGEVREVFNTRGRYKFKPDPRGKHLADVFAMPITQVHAEIEHTHSKPLDWIRLLLGNCTMGGHLRSVCRQRLDSGRR